MSNSYKIEISGLDDVCNFVDKWSPLYSYKNEYKYDQFILTALDDKNSFVEMFKWKNGTGDVISKPKMKSVLGYWDKIDVLRNLKSSFSWEVFEEEFQPQKSSSIWKLFLLHIMNPKEFPIFDQHVFRSYNFFTNGQIQDIPDSDNQKFQVFKSKYKDWFKELVDDKVPPKKLDESLFCYGQMLKGLKKYSVKIIR